MILNSSLRGDWDICLPVEEKQELVHSKISKFLNLRKGLLFVSMSQKKRKRQGEDGQSGQRGISRDREELVETERDLQRKNVDLWQRLWKPGRRLEPLHSNLFTLCVIKCKIVFKLPRNYMFAISWSRLCRSVSSCRLSGIHIKILLSL